MIRAALVALLCASAAAVATAQSPLERRISIHAHNVSLRDALDRVAQLGTLHLSYSGESVPVDRVVSIDADSTTVGEALAMLLAGVPVQAVSTGDDYIVLTPREHSAAPSVPVLDRVVVTGSASGGSARPLAVALDVVQGRDAERRNETSLADVFDGSVPGMWVWQQSPTSFAANYGSIRGASSFGLTLPKVYIDGVEVANPLLLTQITPEVVDRVEVIRGPQGAALYGADAISGVVNIVSRHEGTRADGSHAQLRSDAGYTTSDFTQSAIPVQSHELSLRGGSSLRSGGVSVGVSTSGDYIPRSFSRELRTLGDARIVASRSTLTFNGRFDARNAGVPDNPLLAALNPEEVHADSLPQRLRMYALGSTLTIAQSQRWTYALIAGVDGYSLANAVNEQSPIPSVADTALRDASGAANRGTVRASAVTTAGSADKLGATFTFAAEGSALRDETLTERAASNDSVPEPFPGRNPVGARWTTNGGVSLQSNIAVRDALYLTGGMRLERIAQSIGASQSAALPMLGTAYVKDFGGVTAKVRAAYGRGIRAAHSSTALVMHESRREIWNAHLQPESQSGVEAGADLFVGPHVSLHVTRFDQLASGLTQSVTIVDTVSHGGPGGGQGRYWFQQQNVGEITNRGWEAQGSLALGSLTLGSAASWVDSRVRRVAFDYTGDLRPGDRMLGVPARTISGTAMWSARRLSLSSTLSRASDWINYDRLAIAQTIIANNGDATSLDGARLRTFWINYSGATRLRATASYDVWRGTLMTLTGENLLNYQRGEPDSITITPGRTIMVGLRVHF
jgi:hypothetical protein